MAPHVPLLSMQTTLLLAPDWAFAGSQTPRPSPNPGVCSPAPEVLLVPEQTILFLLANGSMFNRAGWGR